MSDALSTAKYQTPAPGNAKLLSAYNRWFEVIPANSSELREEAFRLRYQVYCCEHEYESSDEHPQELEADAFDCRSIHSLIVERSSGAVTGTVRLILPDHEAPEASFPIQNICAQPLMRQIPVSSAAEVSRFAISKKIRKMTDQNYPKELRCAVVLGLMKATVQMSLRHGITDWFAAMEPPLLRLLRRFGIHFAPIGPIVQYHGSRQPCHVNVQALLDTVHHENYALWKFVTEPGG